MARRNSPAPESKEQRAQREAAEYIAALKKAVVKDIAAMSFILYEELKKYPTLIRSQQ